MSTNTLTIQSELYKQLSTLNIPVYDYIPTDAKMPYIKLGYMNMKDYSTKTNEGIQVNQYIDIFSDYKGQKETREIMHQIMDKMQQFDKESLDLDISLVNTEILEEKDKEQSINSTPKGSIFHGVLIYKIKSI